MRAIPLVPDHYYHIYNRGVNGGSIFFTQENWGFFLRRLRHYLTYETGCIIAYCLMPNHYHLLVHVNCVDFGLRVMQPFTVSFTKAINQQQGRFGPLFQGAFQAIPVEQDSYLLHLTRYIHLNPVSANLVKEPHEWQFSSYRDYIGQRQGTLPQKEVILGQFPSLRAYKEFVEVTIETDLPAKLMIEEPNPRNRVS